MTNTQKKIQTANAAAVARFLKVAEARAKVLAKWEAERGYKIPTISSRS
jgi:hypothetical protein